MRTVVLATEETVKAVLAAAISGTSNDHASTLLRANCFPDECATARKPSSPSVGKSFGNCPLRTDAEFGGVAAGVAPVDAFHLIIASDLWSKAVRN